MLRWPWVWQWHHASRPLFVLRHLSVLRWRGCQWTGLGLALRTLLHCSPPSLDPGIDPEAQLLTRVCTIGFKLHIHVDPVKLARARVSLASTCKKQTIQFFFQNLSENRLYFPLVVAANLTFWIPQRGSYLHQGAAFIIFLSTQSAAASHCHPPTHTCTHARAHTHTHTHTRCCCRKWKLSLDAWLFNM